MTETEKRPLFATGMLLAALGSAVWLAVTANAIGAGLVVSDLAFPPLPGLLIGKVIALILLAMCIPIVVSRGDLSTTRRRAMVIWPGVIAVLLVTSVLTVWLWNRHAHGIDDHSIEAVGEAILLVAAASSATALSTLGAVRLRSVTKRPNG